MRRLASMTRARDFRRVLTEGGKGRSDGLVVHTVARPGEALRVGMSVPRSVGSAVVRNRMRRRLRAAFQEVRADGADVLVTVSRAAVDQSFQKLAEHLKRALTSAKTGETG